LVEEMKMQAKARAHVYVSGRVQGVFFRSETAELAQRLGLCGWVRNLSDGRVEVMFEGDKENVERAVDFCKKGPLDAFVTNLQVKWETWVGEFRGFKVMY
jgi:acylphosphatase